MEWVDHVQEGKRYESSGHQVGIEGAGRARNHESEAIQDQTYALVCLEETWWTMVIVALTRNMIVRQYEMEGAFL